MFESIFETITTDTAISVGGLLLTLGVAFILGLIISIVYMKTHPAKTPSQNFALTLIMLPIVVTVIILLVGNSVARAFSLAGAFSIIRFRSAPGDSKDITYVLLSMAIGLATGMGYILYATIITLVLCTIMVCLHLLKFGNVSTAAKILKITIPEDLDYQSAFEPVLSKYTLMSKLQRVKTTDLGSLYELVYAITTQDQLNEKEFIDMLRCRNGNLNITLILDAPTGEF